MDQSGLIETLRGELNDAQCWRDQTLRRLDELLLDSITSVRSDEELEDARRDCRKARARVNSSMIKLANLLMKQGDSTRELYANQAD